MKFLWPEQLWLVLLVPFLAMLYAWLLRRRKKNVLRLSTLALVKEALENGGNWRRHLPATLLLGALVSLIVASARPLAVITLPTQRQVIILAMDVSGSMRATDVAPSRITASQAAAKSFVAELPASVRIGIVAYAGTAHLVQAPTLSREDVNAAIDQFQLQRGTAIGSGILVALATIFPSADIDISNPAGQRMPWASRIDHAQKPSQAHDAVEPGSYRSAVIVLLTDGQNTTGPEPMEAAQAAASYGVKVFTVGFGTKDGETIGFEGWSMRVRLDEDTLKRVANLTLGEYFHAGSGTDLKNVYAALKTRLVFEKRETEVTVLFADLAALMVLLAAVLSVWWYGRVV